jgi:predicted ATPase/DNA-binding winged helix-turn-helix (wHTH) protein
MGPSVGIRSGGKGNRRSQGVTGIVAAEVQRVLPTLVLSTCTVELEGGVVYRRDRSTVRLTTRERVLLAYLSERPGAAVSRAELLEQVWHYHPDTITRVDIATMNRLRKKIERDPHAPDHLLTVHGEGYRFVPLPADVAAPQPHLPAERDRWIGREADLERLAGAFDGGARLVTVTGIGGAGKTRLALRYGWTHRAAFPGEPWFVDLADARDAPAVSAAARRGLETSDIIRALASKGRCLVVLDNFEQVVACAPETVGAWLDRAPEACFLVTSREPLGIPGETVLSLGPLDPDDALLLFRDRASAAGGQSVDDADVRSLVALLDGIPLAIELAAARARSMRPDQMVERMGERFELLTKSRGRPDRQATLRATLDWSWDLLSRHEQAALMQLSVFEGGFTLAAAEAVLDLGPDAPPCADVVESLVDKSLVTPMDGRFGFLVTVRDYAAMRLAALDDPATNGSTVQRRHIQFFARMAQALREGGGPYGRVDLRETENLIAACRSAVDQGDLSSAAALVWPTWNALYEVGANARGGALVEAVLGIPGALGSPTVRMVHARVRWFRGDFEGASTESSTALELARAANDVLVEAYAYRTLGAVEQERYRPDAARVAYERSLDLALAIGDEGLRSTTVASLALLAGEEGDLAHGIRLLTAESAQPAAGNAVRRSHVLTLLGHLQLQTGDVRGANGRYEEARAIARAAGHAATEVDAMNFMASVAVLVGDLESARALLEASRVQSALWIHTEYSWHWAAAELASASSDVAAARLHYARVAAIAESGGKYASQLDGWMALAELTLDRQDLAFVDDARDRIEQQSKRNQGRLWNLIGVLDLAEGRRDRARAALDRSEAILRRIGDVPYLWRTLVQRALLDASVGDVARAREALDEVEAISLRLGARPESEIRRRLESARRAMG